MISIGQWEKATGGELIAPGPDKDRASSRVLNGLVHDSRAVRPGCCFACIKGERVDGHDFAQAAVDAGAALILAERNPFAADSVKNSEPPVPLLLVEDTVKAMGKAASLARSLTGAKVVGITGTAGKTTLKELLAAILSTRGKVSKNPLNLNNQIGLPESMLNAAPDADYWVMEAGISQPDDMDELGAILRPDVAVILNVGAGHTAGLGDKGVAAYKARLLAHLARNESEVTGMGLINAAYPDLVREARALTSQLEFFSAEGRSVPYRATYAGPAKEGNGAGRYRLALDGKTVEIVAPFQGAFWAENLAACAAAAHLLGFGSEEISAGLHRAELPPQRNNICRAGAFTVIDDTYNANPLSMARMLEAAHEQAASGPLLLVLGEMLELGDSATDEHEALGRRIAQCQPEAVFWKGGQAEAVRAGLEAEEYRKPFVWVAGSEDFLTAFDDLEFKEGLILFKGSRGNRLEALLSAFIKKTEAAAA